MFDVSDFPMICCAVKKKLKKKKTSTINNVKNDGMIL